MVSLAVIQPVAYQGNLNRKEFSPSPREAGRRLRTGSWKQGLRQNLRRTWLTGLFAMTTYLTFLNSTGPPAQGGTGFSGLGPRASIGKQENVAQTHHRLEQFGWVFG